MKNIFVIDYDAGNTMSVINALKYLGYDVTLTNDAAQLLKAEHCIFPGVGAYAEAMKKLKENNIDAVIKELVNNSVPMLGICLGMQMLFDKSNETIGSDNEGSVPGLGILKGCINGFRENKSFELKVPHMGWNSINILNPDSKLYRGIPNGSHVYFVHSFYLNASERADVATTTEYGITFDSSVEHGNLFGCQFHPEKSGDIGLSILKNFCEI